MDKTFPILLSSDFQKSVLPKVQNFDFSKEFEEFCESFRKSTENDRSFIEFKTIKSHQDLSAKDIQPAGILQNNDSHPNTIENSFDFELILKSSFETPLCKCKYFQFQIALKQLKNVELPKSETIQVDVEVVSNDGVVITKNMKGFDILKGGTSRIMHYFEPENSHVAYFRLQLTEVSSHYSQKTLNLQLIPHQSPFLVSTGYKIKSLLIPRLKIRAKRSSKA